MRKMLAWSSQHLVTLLNAGERSADVAVPVATVLLSIFCSNPPRLIYPEEGVLATIAPSAIVRNALHSNAAKLFMESQTWPQMMTILLRYGLACCRRKARSRPHCAARRLCGELAPAAVRRRPGFPGHGAFRHPRRRHGDRLLCSLCLAAACRLNMSRLICAA